MAGEIGNNFSNKNNRMVADTLRRIAIQEDGKKLRAMCEAIYEKAAAGDVQAAVFISDRLDGKPAQSLTLGNEEGQEFKVAQRIELVALGDNSTD